MLGIVTEGSTYKHADIGLGCTKNKMENGVNRGEWRAYAWGSYKVGNNLYNIDWNWDFGENYLFHYTDTVRVDVTISVSSGIHRIQCDFYAFNTHAARCYFETVAGQMFSVVNNLPMVRFVRFMSLVPIETLEELGTKDDLDYSFLKGAIRNLKLGNVTWDVSKIQHAWSVQTENISDLKLSVLNATSIGTDADSIHIYHDTQTH